MNMPRPLVEAIYGAIALLAHSPDDEVSPDIAVRGLEDIAASLLDLTADEQVDFLAICVEIARAHGHEPGTGIAADIADTLGLSLPSA